MLKGRVGSVSTIRGAEVLTFATHTRVTAATDVLRHQSLVRLPLMGVTIA